jgi:hypothetical protein
MTRRGDLLGLVDGAPGPLRTIEAALTRWVDRGLVAAVHHHLARAFRADGSDWGVRHEGGATADKRVEAAGGGSRVVAESLSYVLVAPPDRWRVVGRGHIAVSDGHRAWVGTGSLVTERDSARATIHDAGPVGACLYPGPLLGWLDFGDPEPDEWAGCFCWTVDARPRPLAKPLSSRLPEEFLGVEHRFWFEARTGVVLRHEGLFEGEACSMTELTDVIIDEPIPADEFAPPPDAIVRTSHELLRDHLTELGVDPDSVDLDDPVQVRRALRQGNALGPVADPESLA